MMSRTALLGGTFNPVHIGHLRLALNVAESLELERVELMPCASAPHKEDAGILPFEMRVDILRAAIADEPRLGVCTLEAELPAPSYTWNTAHIWKERYHSVPTFILGDEDFAAMDTWHRGTELPSVMDIIVIPRVGASLYLDTLARLWPHCQAKEDPALPGALCADMGNGRMCRFLPVPRIELSATEIRRRFLAGQNLRWLMPDAAIEKMQSYADKARSVWS